LSCFILCGFASLWILLSDKTVELLLNDPAGITLTNTLKAGIRSRHFYSLYGFTRRLIYGLQQSRDERFRLAMEATNDGLCNCDIEL
jgi:hypothetical protein